MVIIALCGNPSRRLDATFALNSTSQRPYSAGPSLLGRRKTAWRAAHNLAPPGLIDGPRLTPPKRHPEVNLDMGTAQNAVAFRIG
jgi:hypothetical protein